MNLRELHEVTSKLLAAGVDPTLKVATQGPYGDLETELRGIREHTLDRRVNRGDRLIRFIVLEGIIPSMYPDTD